MKIFFLKRITTLACVLFVFHVAVGQNNISNSTVNWKAQWVTATEQQNETNNWTAYNKTFKVGEVPGIAPDLTMQGKPLTDIYKEESDIWRKQFYYEQLSLKRGCYFYL